MFNKSGGRWIRTLGPPSAATPLETANHLSSHRLPLATTLSLSNSFGRHSLRRAEDGWVWKFDREAMGSRRFGEPVREYLQAVGCRASLMFGEKSALVSRETASYMSSLMGPRAPVVEVPEARHHVMLDQPLGFVAALRMLLDSWMRNESAEGSGPPRAWRGY
jgi:pimeloyl-ACP methyl ester carboxylesterase